jgi:hypothetical protein
MNRVIAAILFFAAVAMSWPAYAVIAGGCTNCVAGGMNQSISYAEILQSYAWRQALVVAAFYICGYLLGRLVEATKLTPSFSRKIICLVTFGISFANSLSLQASGAVMTCVLIGVGCTVILLMLGSLCKFLRDRIAPLRTVFASINRPEDEPYTLPWLATEAVVTSAVIAVFVPVIAYFAQTHVSDPAIFYALMLIPIFASGVGDALAEIVGKKWGRHHYTTHAIFGKRSYTRTFEGSAMVFVTTLVVGLIVAAQFAFVLPVFFWKAFLLLPFTLTLAEAKAPHTWDNPILYLVGYLTIIISLL